MQCCARNRHPTPWMRMCCLSELTGASAAGLSLCSSLKFWNYVGDSQIFMAASRNIRFN